MFRPRPAAVALPLCAALLAGCASTPRNDLLDVVADVTEAANDGDAAQLRGALANLRAEIDGQVRANELSTDESARLLAIVQQLEADAALIEQPEEEPSPTPSSASPTPEEESPSPSPSPSPSRSPSARPTPTEEPQETEEPEEPEEPEESEEPEPIPTDIVPSPAATSAEPSPSSSPAQAVRTPPARPSPSGA